MWACLFFLADSIMGGDPGNVKEGQDNRNNDCCFSYVLVPIPSEDLSLHMSFATNAKSLRLYIWYRLVGNRSKLNCLLRCLSCKLKSLLLATVLVVAYSGFGYLHIIG